MIDSNQRLVVMAENDAGDIPWYHLAYRTRCRRRRTGSGPPRR